jgi:hypothetical protein
MLARPAAENDGDAGLAFFFPRVLSHRLDDSGTQLQV